MIRMLNRDRGVGVLISRSNDNVLHSKIYLAAYFDAGDKIQERGDCRNQEN